MAENVNDLFGLAPRLRKLLDGGEGESQAVFSLRGTVDFADDGVPVSIGLLPVGALIVGATVDVTTAFNDTGTDLIDVGNGTTADFYQADIDGAVVGQTVDGWSNLGEVGSDVEVTATYTGQNSNATAGEATVTVFYVSS